jgi:hypothetical protein
MENLPRTGERTSGVAAARSSAYGRRDRKDVPMARELEPWGGEVHMPGWLRRLLHRQAPPGDTPEHAHERREPRPTTSVAENANRAATGSLVDLYREGRGQKRR